MDIISNLCRRRESNPQSRNRNTVLFHPYQAGELLTSFVRSLRACLPKCPKRESNPHVLANTSS